MLSTFKHGAITVLSTNSLPAYVPIGVTLRPGFIPSDPANNQGKFRIVGAELSVTNGNMTYAIEPV